MLLKARKDKKREKRIDQLCRDREGVRNSIRGIQKMMDALVQKAAKSDDLDRKICSAEYQTLRDQLQAEWQQFEDLNRLIGQLKNAGMTRQRADAFEKIASINSQVDLDEMISREDSMAIRRQMMREENEEYREVLDQAYCSNSLTGEDEEFSRLVARAQIQDLSANDRNTEKPVPAEACLSL